jgi:DNA mismatch repair ATPase MutS
MRRWGAAVGEMEALASIAAYHYEHPEEVFAELVEGPPRFEAEAAGHPLLPAHEAVGNDVSFGGDAARVVLVSGSNMSGKSTLLRTIGVSAVLAQAGVPVRVKSLRLSPLAVGASIRLADSLQEGESRFYAEILRLRAIVEQAGEYEVEGRADGDALDGEPSEPPVLFLIDEFLHGTISHDRRIGAEAIVRGLVDRGAIGLVTTHDLALTHIADVLGEGGANVHFEDHLEDGRMRFDYRMRPGVVEKSNALELMRSVGLDV